MTDQEKLKVAYTRTTFEFGIAIHFPGAILFYTEGRHIVQRNDDTLIHILDKDFKILGIVYEDKVLAINRIPRQLSEDESSLPHNSFVQ